MLNMIDAINKLYRFCRLSNPYCLQPSSSKLAASTSRSNTGTKPDEKENPSANWNWESDPPKGSESAMDASTDKGIIKRNAGNIFNCINRGFFSRFIKSFFIVSLFVVAIITAETIKGAIIPGSINSIYSPLLPS